MSKTLEGKKLIFCDFEVFANSIHPVTNQPYWMVVFIEYDSKKKFTIKNDTEKLRWFYSHYKDHIFVGYNIRGYDQWVMKGAILGQDTGHITKQIIEHDKKGYHVVKNNYSVPLNIYDVATGFHGLKQLEAFMGSKIKESDVPFDLDRPLTLEEEIEVEEYCTHDVEQTILVFDKLKNKFDAQVGLLDMFDLDVSLISKTSAQLTAEILEAKKVDNMNDEFEFIYPDTYKIEKYTQVKEFFDSVKNGTFVATSFEKGKPKIEMTTLIAGTETTYALGGLHAAIPNFIYEGKIYSLDVASLYPALILEYGLMSRACESDEKFRYIRDERIVLKRAKNPLQEALKLAINTVYGTFGDQYNPLCDKRMMRSVCVAGQLLLTDFIEKIEPYCTLFNLNTDGVFFTCENDDDLAKIIEAQKEWESRTRLVLELEHYVKVIQKDVNNYIVVPEGELYYPSGKPRWKAKGAYVKELKDIDYDLPIVNFAMVNYFLKDKPIADTINECNDLRDFQKVVKLTNKYDYALKDSKFDAIKVLNEETGKMNKKVVCVDEGFKLKDKTFRVFASTREEDGGIYKKKTGENPAKFANTPEKCFIDNDEVLGKAVPEYLDRQHYIDMAQKRINQYLGIKNKPVKKAK